MGDYSRIFLCKKLHQVRSFSSSLVSLIMALNFISGLSCGDWSVGITKTVLPCNEAVLAILLSARPRSFQQTLLGLSLKQSVGAGGVVLIFEYSLASQLGISNTMLLHPPRIPRFPFSVEGLIVGFSGWSLDPSICQVSAVICISFSFTSVKSTYCLVNNQ